MSQENVEIVRANFEAWNAGDMEAFRERYDPGIVVRPVEGWPEPGPYVGRGAVMRQWERQRETFDADDALIPMSRRLQPRNDKFFTLCSNSAWRKKASSHDMR